MKRFVAATAVLLGLAFSGNALKAQVKQTGSVTPNHAACWSTTGVIKDCGSATLGTISSLGVTASGPALCQQSAASGAFNRVCLSATATAGGIAMTNVGGATGGFTFTLNGVTQGMGTVTLPVTTGDLACFADATGTLNDCGGNLSGMVVTNHAVAVGTGALSFTSVGPGATGTVFVGNTGADPAFTSAPALVNTQNAASLVGLTNASAGTSAYAAFQTTNSNGSASFGLGGSSYTATLLLQNSAFIVADAALAGIVLYNIGDDAIVFALNAAERARFQPTSLSGANGVITVGLTGSLMGSIGLLGSTSGVALLTAQATAGSPTLTLPNTTGTFAVGATSPLVLSATTGGLTCPTCVTSSGGGAITGVAPVAVSGAGAVSITGAAGQVLAGASPAFTATPTLGASGTPGSLIFGNATSGLLTLQTVTGALGTATVSLPAATTTLAGLAVANIFTATQQIVISQDTLTVYGITNVNTGTAATAALVTTNANGNGTFGIGGANYTGATLLQNRAFVAADAALAGIALYNTGDDPIIFALNAAERARFQPTSLSGANGVITVGLTGSLMGSIGLLGSTSGVALLTAQATAGTPTLTIGTTSGTIASSATSPLAISATTGVITCTTCGVTSSGLNQFASTTSAQLFGVISDETGGSGVAVGNISPVLTTPDINGGTADSLTSLSVRDTGAAFDLAFASTGTAPSANHTLTWNVNNADRNIAIAGNLSIQGNFTTAGSNALTLTTTGSTNVTLPTTGTLAILGANTFTANQALTLSTDSGLSYTVTNTSTGTSAVGLMTFANSANSGSFGMGGTGYTGTAGLQNRAFMLASAGTDGIAIMNAGDDDIIFYLNAAERARFQDTANAPTSGVITIGLTGSLTGSVGLLGSTSGVALLTAPAAAGTPVLTTGTVTGTLAVSANNLSFFAATTSAQLAGVISNETGTGSLTFATQPGFNTSITVTANATAVTPPTNTLIHTIAANSTDGQTTMDIFATFGTHTFRRANTSAASPSGLLTADLIGGMNARGYTSSGAYTTANAAAFFFAATENWSSTATGAEVQFYTTLNTTASLAKVMTIQNSGGLSIGATTDPGAGGLYVNGATITLNGLATDATHTDRTVCQDSTSKSLFFGSGAVGICLGTSGAQFKTAFAPMMAGLDEIAKLNLQNYRYRAGYGDDGAHVQYGLTAQDVETVIPDLVRHNSRGETINYDWGALVFVGFRAIQQLKAANDNLKLEIEDLKQRIAK